VGVGGERVPATASRQVQATSNGKYLNTQPAAKTIVKRQTWLIINLAAAAGFSGSGRKEETEISTALSVASTPNQVRTLDLITRHSTKATNQDAKPSQYVSTLGLETSANEKRAEYVFSLGRYR
jgi:hypothetical protein